MPEHPLYCRSVLDPNYVNELKQFAKQTNIENHIICTNQIMTTFSIINNSKLIYFIVIRLLWRNIWINHNGSHGRFTHVISDFAGYKDHITDGVEGYLIPTISGNTNSDLSFYLTL